MSRTSDIDIQIRRILNGKKYTLTESRKRTDNRAELTEEVKKIKLHKTKKKKVETAYAKQRRNKKNKYLGKVAYDMLPKAQTRYILVIPNKKELIDAISGEGDISEVNKACQTIDERWRKGEVGIPMLLIRYRCKGATLKLKRSNMMQFSPWEFSVYNIAYFKNKQKRQYGFPETHLGVMKQKNGKLNEKPSSLNFQTRLLREMRKSSVMSNNDTLKFDEDFICIGLIRPDLDMKKSLSKLELLFQGVVAGRITDEKKIILNKKRVNNNIIARDDTRDSNIPDNKFMTKLVDVINRKFKYKPIA